MENMQQIKIFFLYKRPLYGCDFILNDRIISINVSTPLLLFRATFRVIRKTFQNLREVRRSRGLPAFHKNNTTFYRFSYRAQLLFSNLKEVKLV